MRSIKFRNAMLCDFVAKGAGNKNTLVNTFSGNVIINEFPAAFNAGFYVEILPHGGETREIIIEVYLGRKRLGYVSAEFEELSTDEPSALAIPILPIAVERVSKLRMVASCEGFRRTTLLEKTIYDRATFDAIASARLSEQSPPGALA